MLKSFSRFCDIHSPELVELFISQVKTECFRPRVSSVKRTQFLIRGCFIPSTQPLTPLFQIIILYLTRSPMHGRSPIVCNLLSIFKGKLKHFNILFSSSNIILSLLDIKIEMVTLHWLKLVTTVSHITDLSLVTGTQSWPVIG